MNIRPNPPVTASAFAAGDDWTIPQAWDAYTPLEHATWDGLYARQIEVLRGRVTPAFFHGLDRLDMGSGGIPNLERLSERLTRLTGWRVAAVPGLVPDEVFFRNLANRTFVAGRFIRTPEQFDYLREPDIFHDVFGHVPLLAQPRFADYMQAYGEGGLRSLEFGAMEKLARLYWYTVEFGLMKSAGGLELYGAGIVSSAAESVFALEDASPNRIGFDLRRVMRTRYRIDDFQQTYFVIESFEDLLRQTLETDFGPLYRDLEAASEIAPDAVLARDTVLHLGDQHRQPRPLPTLHGDAA
jgi:phenylalanine-4-hydroxylase